MYSITAQDVLKIDSKLEQQKKYITNRLFDFGDETKSALDFTYSANLNPKKYFAEMNNRINSIFQYAKELNLKPVFCTITAPSKYHQTSKDKKLLISPNETAKELTQIFNKFTNLQVFQRMKKELGHGLIYFRVYEPHKSGVPHLHCMIFIPLNYILEVKKKFYEYFTDLVRWGNNKKSLDFRYTWYNSEIGAISYIMKYVTKTFKNEDDKSIQYSTYWYIKYNIRRFLCSRTLAPILLYRKVRYFFKNFENDYLQVSKLVKNGQILKLFDNTTYNYMRVNIETGDIEDITVWQKSAELILQNRIKLNQTFTIKYNKQEQKTALSVFVNDFERYVHSERLNKFVLLPVVPSKLKDWQLTNYYKTLEKTNINDLNLVHFGVVKNEMIKRELLKEDPINLNEYNTSFDFETKTNYLVKFPISFIALDKPDYNIPFLVEQNFYKDF